MNKIELHDECINARDSCEICAKAIASVLGIPLSVFKMLRAYIFRTEQGSNYEYIID